MTKKQSVELIKPESNTGFTPQQEEFIKNIFSGENSIFNKPNGNDNGFSTDDYKQLESIKWILTLFANKDFIKSATNLTEDELEDINNAYMINEYADCPELANWLASYLEMARSRVFSNSPVKNLIQLLSDISGKTGYSINPLGEQNMILGKLRR